MQKTQAVEKTSIDTGIKPQKLKLNMLEADIKKKTSLMQHQS